MKNLQLSRLNRPILYFSGLIGITLLVLTGGYHWASLLWVQIISAIFFTLAVAGILYYRGFLKHGKLPNTRLEVFFSGFLSVIVLTWITSSDLRQSLDRVIQILIYVLCFYVFYELFSILGQKKFWIYFWLIITGVLLIGALVEVSTAYRNWFTLIAPDFEQPPYLYRFTGTLGHSNPLMALVNLFLPICLVFLFTSKKLWQRMFFALWLVVYALGLIFSSSRGGVLGIIGGLIILLLLSILHHGWFIELKEWIKRKPRLSIAIFIFIGVIILAIGLASMFTFLQHPSHGAGFWDSRLSIWQKALQIWESSPLIGIGPGRFPFEYLKISHSIPPGEWITNAHQTLLTTLVESGLLGCIALVVLIVGIFQKVISLYRILESEHRLVVAGAMAGIFGFILHSLVDDFTDWPVVMISCVFLLAWIFSFTPESERKNHDISIHFLWVPAGIVVLCISFILSAYIPFWSGYQDISKGNFKNTSHELQKSILRDPNLTYYQMNVGLLRAQEWAQKNDPEMLVLARYDLKYVVDAKPELGWIGADLAMLDWQLGNSMSAIHYLEKDIQSSPLEASYPLNLGWIYEQSGDATNASMYYQAALDLSPAWGNHPFWAKNEFRKQVLSAWEVSHTSLDISSSEEPYWQKAISALNSDVHAAAKYVALARWTEEPVLPVFVAQSKLYMATGQVNEEIKTLEQVMGVMEQSSFYQNTSYTSTYAQWVSRRVGITNDMVPGFIHLEEDVGQFEALERLMTLYTMRGQCSQMQAVWDVYQTSRSGFALESYPSAPLCPDK
jgi:O-antigen ligase/tetratricopeptide (TPR) repeat protein